MYDGGEGICDGADVENWGGICGRLLERDEEDEYAICSGSFGAEVAHFGAIILGWVESGAESRSRDSERRACLSSGEPGGEDWADVDCGNLDEVALVGKRFDVESMSIALFGS